LFRRHPLFGALQFLGTLAAPLFGVAGDRFGRRNMLLSVRATLGAVSATIAVLAAAAPGPLATATWSASIASLPPIITTYSASAGSDPRSSNSRST